MLISNPQLLLFFSIIFLLELYNLVRNLSKYVFPIINSSLFIILIIVSLIKGVPYNELLVVSLMYLLMHLALIKKGVNEYEL